MEAGRDLQSPELVLACAVLLLGALAAWCRLPVGEWWERPLSRLASHRRLAVLVAALLPLIIRLALLYRFPPPEPRLHDEFSFLLGARTLLEGRLANPVHPFWPHFESMHILARPSYSSAFPPGQAVALAIGLLLGHPWIGIWLSVGAMCGCICWMLQGWLPSRWALLGALLLGVKLGVSSYWMNSYWGGALAAAGGALVLGSLSRLHRRLHWHYSVTLAVGLAVLAITRSFEGAVFALLAAAVLLRVGRPWGMVLRHVVIPLGILMTILAAGLGLYFARVTGSPWNPPYVLYRSSMTMAPHFIWQTNRPEPVHNNREMRDFYIGHEMANYRHSRESPWTSLFEKASHYWRFYWGPMLTIPLLAVPLLWHDRRIRRLLWVAVGFSLALAGEVWDNAHYAAPATGLFLLIAMLGMRRLYVVSWNGSPIGCWLVRLVPLGCVAMLILQVSAARIGEGTSRASWRWPSTGGVARARILQNLTALPGGHLVFVRYSSRHDPGDEWVYNEADIDASRVVWARNLDRFSNTRLMAHFSSRQVWLVEPDVSATVIPYHAAPPRAMFFMPLGTPGIESLRSAEVTRQKIQTLAGDRLLTCDQWNYYFTESTGVMGPVVTKACYSSNDRAQPVGFPVYFDWLQRQR